MSRRSSIILENGCREIRLPLTPFSLEIDGMVVWCWRKLVPPGDLVLLKKEQVSMAEKVGFRFKFALPAAANPGDVATRKIVAKSGDSVIGEYPVGVLDVETGWIPPTPPGFDEGSVVGVQVVDFDAKGNMTAGPAIDLNTADDVGPAVPGSLSVLAKDQVTVTVPDPEPLPG